MFAFNNNCISVFFNVFIYLQVIDKRYVDGYFVYIFIVSTIFLLPTVIFPVC